MSKKKPTELETSPVDTVLQLSAEVAHADELAALAQHDADPKPANWALSPRAVIRYVLGGDALKAEIDGQKREVPITRKFFGER